MRDANSVRGGHAGATPPLRARSPFGRLATVAMGVALCAALAKAPPALASADPPHPPIADCKQAWTDSSAQSTCHTENYDTEPGNCVISAQCKRTGVFSAGDPVPDNCVRLRIAQSVVGPSEYEQWCESSVTFPPATTTDVANCDGKLKTSNC